MQSRTLSCLSAKDNVLHHLDGRRHTGSMGIPPRPIAVGAPSNAVTRSRRKYHNPVCVVVAHRPATVCLQRGVDRSSIP